MATIKDIAARAGVTATTVSRVINNRGYISEETRKKVTQAMQEMNYQPNELARSLAKAHSNTIGVIVPHISHPFFSKMIRYYRPLLWMLYLVCSSNFVEIKASNRLSVCICKTGGHRIQ